MTADESTLGFRGGEIRVKPPGPNSRRLAGELRQFESRNVTFISDDFPIFFSRAAGANVVDVDENVYVDLTGFFGVAATGHSNARVAAAVGEQAGRLFHGMGDVYPTENKVALARALCEITPGDGPKRVIFSSTGAEAVEAAVKTAVVATGKPLVLCFTGAYHGLTYGALELTDRDLFRSPFARQLGHFGRRAAYPYCYRCPLGLVYPSCKVACLDFVRQALDADGGSEIGAIVVEPVQGRGGEVPAPSGWLQELRRVCDERGLLLIFDEIFSGFGRTGRWFASQHAGVIPDMICIGKGLSSGFPISACVGKAEVMDCWPVSGGEAVHTSTFLGHPTGCAAALATIAEIRERRLVERAAELDGAMRKMLTQLQKASKGKLGDVRGMGLMWGLECVRTGGQPDPAAALAAMRAAMQRGVLILTSGPASNVLAVSPPLVISEDQLDFAMVVLAQALAQS